MMLKLIHRSFLLYAVFAPTVMLALTPRRGGGGTVNGIVPGIPEPTSAAVFAVGAALVVVALRKRSK